MGWAGVYFGRNIGVQYLLHLILATNNATVNSKILADVDKCRPGKKIK